MAALKILVTQNRFEIDIKQISRQLPEPCDIIESDRTDEIISLVKSRAVDTVIICSGSKAADSIPDIIKNIRIHDRSIPVIFVTKYSSEELAISALKAGVNDYLNTPFSINELIRSIRRLTSKNFPNHISVRKQDNGNSPMISKSRVMKDIKEYLHKIAQTDSSLLITGESGTGKELAAEMVHNNSSRSKKPFICINCAALPENLVESELFGYDRGAFTGAVSSKPGKFVMAEGGSVFLDEIGDMNPYAQAKILRSIESKEVYPLGSTKVIPLNIRIIAATNKDPKKLIENGKFREDLYYRLNVARVELPSLKERKEDISQLIDHAVIMMNKRFNRRVKGFTDEAMAVMFRYDWPGNVRELINLTEAAFIHLPSFHVDYIELPERLRQHLDMPDSVSPDERRMLVSALTETSWNKSRAAKKLRWSRTTLYRKITEYNVVENRSPER